MHHVHSPGNAHVVTMCPNHHMLGAQVFGTCFGVRDTKAHGFGCLITTGEQHRKKLELEVQNLNLEVFVFVDHPTNIDGLT